MKLKKPNGFEENQKDIKKPDKDNDKDNEEDNEEDIKKKNKRKNFKKPTIEEIKSYCNERKNSINAQYFYDYYESNGWKVGKNAMKDWQATIRTWEKRNRAKGDLSIVEDF